MANKKLDIIATMDVSDVISNLEKLVKFLDKIGDTRKVNIELKGVEEVSDLKAKIEKIPEAKKIAVELTGKEQIAEAKGKIEAIPDSKKVDIQVAGKEEIAEAKSLLLQVNEAAAKAGNVQFDTSSVEKIAAASKEAAAGLTEKATAAKEANVAIAGIDPSGIKAISEAAASSKDSLSGLAGVAKEASAAIATIDPSALHDTASAASDASASTADVAASGTVTKGVLGGIAALGIGKLFDKLSAQAGQFADRWTQLHLVFGRDQPFKDFRRNFTENVTAPLTEFTGRTLKEMGGPLKQLAVVGVRDTNILKRSIKAMSGYAFMMGKDLDEVAKGFQTLVIMDKLGGMGLRRIGLDIKTIADAVGMSVEDLQKKWEDMSTEQRAATLTAALAAQGAIEANEDLKNSWEGIDREAQRALGSTKRFFGDAILPYAKWIIRTKSAILFGIRDGLRALPPEVQAVIGKVLFFGAAITMVFGAVKALSVLFGKVKFLFTPFVVGAKLLAYTFKKLGIVGAAKWVAMKLGILSATGATKGFIAATKTKISLLKAFAVKHLIAAGVMAKTDKATAASGAAAAKVKTAAHVKGATVSKANWRCLGSTQLKAAGVGKLAAGKMAVAHKTAAATSKGAWAKVGLVGVAGKFAGVKAAIVAIGAKFIGLKSIFAGLGVKAGIFAGLKGALAGLAGFMKIAAAGAALFGKKLLILAGPIGWIVLTLIGLGTAIWHLWHNWDSVTKNLGNAWNWVKTTVGTAISGIGTFLMNLGIQAGIAGISFVNNLIVNIQQLPGRIMTFLEFARQRIIVWKNLIIALALTAGRMFIQRIISEIQQLPGRVAGFLQMVVGRVQAFAGALSGAAAAAGRGLVNGFISAITGLPGQIAGILRGIAGRVMAVGGSLWNAAKNAGRRIWEGFKQGLGIRSPSHLERAIDAIIEKGHELPVEMAKDAAKLSRINWGDAAQNIQTGGIGGHRKHGGKTTIEVRQVIDFANVPPQLSKEELLSVIKAEHLDLAHNREFIYELRKGISLNRHRDARAGGM